MFDIEKLKIQPEAERSNYLIECLQPLNQVERVEQLAQLIDALSEAELATMRTGLLVFKEELELVSANA